MKDISELDIPRIMPRHAASAHTASRAGVLRILHGFGAAVGLVSLTTAATLLLQSG